MNDGFKQRLVGAIVLVLLGLILWPVIFSEGINSSIDRRSEIPTMPAFKKYTVPKPQPPKDIPPLSTPEYSEPTPSQIEPVPAKQQDLTVERPAPKLDHNRLPESWVLQVASFSRAENALELKQGLIKQGYKAYTRTVKAQGSTSTRVYIGPRLRRDAFEKDQSVIDRQYSVKSMVIRFEQ